MSALRNSTRSHLPTGSADRGQGPERFDAIVIGAGEAGSLVASRAVEAGHRVALIYLPPFGSTCLNTGCVPSKYLICRAWIAHLTRGARRFHIEAGPPQVRLGAIVEEKNAMLAGHREAAFAKATEADGLTLIEGSARFVGPHEVAIDGRRISADRIFVATGLRPTIPDIPGLDASRALTSTTIMELREVPERLVVLGGGYVACELGQAFRRFGSEVTIIQSHRHLLPREEPDVSTLLERAMRREGIELRLDQKARRIEHEANRVRVVLQSPHHGNQTVEGTHLLLATGRSPNTDTLAIEHAGLQADEKGHLKVDASLATRTPGIWAIGDVNGQQPFTRVCQEEAKLAYANAFEEAGLSIRREALGHAVFTDPEIATVGLTEAEARRQGFDVAVGLVTFDQVERAQLMDETEGLIKFVVERNSRRILGCHMIGPRAGELIYSVIVEVTRNGRLEDIGRAVGIFPTLHEGIEGTARGLWRQFAPDEARGPLVAGPLNGPRNRSSTMAKDFRCGACGAEFDTREQLDSHNRQQHPEMTPAGKPS